MIPIQCPRIYANPEQNLAASGYYRSWMTQRSANMLPPWMHIRDNPNSIGQQFLSPFAQSIDKLEYQMNEAFKSKYINIAPLDEVDVLYRTKIPSNLDFLDTELASITCLAAPSGHTISGAEQIELKEINSLEEFYYDVLPTRAEVVSSGTYTATVDSLSWNLKPSGVVDKEQKKVDIWKTEHDISWCYAGGYFRKQDVETMEDYETYSLNGSGVLMDMWYNKGILWWVGKGTSEYFLNLTSTKTQMPVATTLDLLTVIDITDAFINTEPSGIIVDKEGSLWIADTNKTSLFEVCPRYDYFIVDKQNRYIYLKEDYTDSGVFISNT